MLVKKLYTAKLTSACLKTTMNWIVRLSDQTTNSPWCVTTSGRLSEISDKSWEHKKSRKVSLLRVCLRRERWRDGGGGGWGGKAGVTEDRVPVTVKSLEKGISDPHNTMFFFFTSYCIKCFCRLEISQCRSKYLNNYQSFARLQSFSPRPLNWKNGVWP